MRHTSSKLIPSPAHKLQRNERVLFLNQILKVRGVSVTGAANNGRSYVEILFDGHEEPVFVPLGRNVEVLS